MTFRLHVKFHKWPDVGSPLSARSLADVGKYMRQFVLLACHLHHRRVTRISQAQ